MNLYLKIKFRSVFFLNHAAAKISYILYLNLFYFFKVKNTLSVERVRISILISNIILSRVSKLQSVIRHSKIIVTFFIIVIVTVSFHFRRSSFRL